MQQDFKCTPWSGYSVFGKCSLSLFFSVHIPPTEHDTHKVTYLNLAQSSVTTVFPVPENKFLSILWQQDHTVELD